MKSSICFFLLFIVWVGTSHAEAPLTRAEGYRMLWETLQRPIGDFYEKAYLDVPKGSSDYELLTYGKARNILTQGEYFHPDDPLSRKDALLMLFRTRNVADPDDVTYDTLTSLLKKYPVVDPANALDDAVLSAATLHQYIASLEQMLKDETHTVSYYGQDFNGDHTAFGEIFDMHAMTAAHRTLPQNTLVRVTNKDTGKSVIVRVNDRGPYAPGRDMDLSRAAFEAIGSLGSGLLHNITFERLGDLSLVEPVDVVEESPQQLCLEPRYRNALGDAMLTPGIPMVSVVGDTVSLTADTQFRILQMRVPKQRAERFPNWVQRGESFTVSYDVPGIYSFIIMEDGGSRRRFRTRVSEGC